MEFSEKEIAPLASIELWEADVLERYPEPQTKAKEEHHNYDSSERGTVREFYRLNHRYPDWFVLTGLMHDMGKVLCLFGEPKWVVVGDTFPVRCEHSDKIVYPEYFVDNPDFIIQNLIQNMAYMSLIAV